MTGVGPESGGFGDLKEKINIIHNWIAEKEHARSG